MTTGKTHLGGALRRIDRKLPLVAIFLLDDFGDGVAPDFPEDFPGDDSLASEPDDFDDFEDFEDFDEGLVSMLNCDPDESDSDELAE